MAGMRDIKRRIKSVHSMRKITRAMQMVSAAKMRKAQNATLASRTYASLAWELIINLSQKPRTTAPLLRSYRKAKKIGIIVISSNMGLVGGLNSSLGTKIKESDTAELISEIVVYGKQGKNLAVRMGKNITADFPKQDKSLTTSDIYPLVQHITSLYTSGEYRKIVLAYNRFISTLVQKPQLTQLLPFAESLGTQPFGERPTEYLFEPKPQKVLEHLLPRIIESQIYQAILESDASEHSARMVMMKNATEAAGDLISDLTLTYNQLRQNKITTELAEITAGKIALE